MKRVIPAYGLLPATAFLLRSAGRAESRRKVGAEEAVNDAPALLLLRRGSQQPAGHRRDPGGRAVPAVMEGHERGEFFVNGIGMADIRQPLFERG